MPCSFFITGQPHMTDPIVWPQNQTPLPDPKKVLLFFRQTLRIDPKKLWETPLNFGEPKKPLIVSLPSANERGREVSTASSSDSARAMPWLSSYVIIWIGETLVLSVPYLMLCKDILTHRSYRASILNIVLLWIVLKRHLFYTSTGSFVEKQCLHMEVYLDSPRQITSTFLRSNYLFL